MVRHAARGSGLALQREHGRQHPQAHGDEVAHGGQRPDAAQRGVAHPRQRVDGDHHDDGGEEARQGGARRRVRRVADGLRRLHPPQQEEIARAQAGDGERQAVEHHLPDGEPAELHGEEDAGIHGPPAFPDMAEPVIDLRLQVGEEGAVGIAAGHQRGGKDRAAGHGQKANERRQRGEGGTMGEAPPHGAHQVAHGAGGVHLVAEADDQIEGREQQQAARRGERGAGDGGRFQRRAARPPRQRHRADEDGEEQRRAQQIRHQDDGQRAEDFDQRRGRKERVEHDGLL